jgi:hypothetical protein
VCAFAAVSFVFVFERYCITTGGERRALFFPFLPLPPTLPMTLLFLCSCFLFCLFLSKMECQLNADEEKKEGGGGTARALSQARGLATIYSFVSVEY